MRRYWWLVALAIVTCASAAGAQTTAAKSAPPPVEKAQWLERANLITAAIQEDAQQLPPDLQIILPGRLAGIWRDVDPKRAQAWLNEADSKLAPPTEQESASDRKARLQAVSALLPDLNRSDPQRADRMLDSVISDVMQKNAGNPRGPGYSPEANWLGLSLERAVMDTAEKDPQRAFALAQRIVQLRDGNGILSAYFNLQSADPQRADQFATEALQAARTNYDPFMFFALAQMAAPMHPDMDVPESLKSQILQALASGMLRVPQGPAEKASICRLASPVTMAMKKFPPAQQPQLQAAVDNCKAADAEARRNVKQMESFADDRPARELLSQAADAGDAQSRADLKMRAAEQAQHAGEYLRALDILTSLAPEEREARPAWESRWDMIAGQAIRDRYKAHDLQAIQNIIGQAPDTQRASLMMSASALAYIAKDDGYGLAMLTQARRELEKNPVSDNYNPYLRLLISYSAHVPEEAASVLRLTVEGINNFKVPEGAKIRPAEPGWRLQEISLPAALLDSDPQMVSAAISELKSPQARVAMRLGLLHACLGRYTATNKPPSQPAAPAKPKPKPDPKPASKTAIMEKK